MTEFLIPENHDASRHHQDPYTTTGARSIVRRFRGDVILMLDEMDANRQRYSDGKTMLAHSPLRSKVHIAAAMKTLGLVEENPTKGGACALILTQKAVDQIEALRRNL